MLERAVVTCDTLQPVVAERHAGQIQPGLRGVDSARQAGKTQVTTQNAVRSAAGEGTEELLRLGHPMTLAQ